MSSFGKVNDFHNLDDHNSVDIEMNDEENLRPTSNFADYVNQKKKTIKGFTANQLLEQAKYELTDWELTEKRKVLLKAVLGEGLCTFLFMFIVMSVGINNQRSETNEGLVLGAVSTAFCSIALIYSFADVSGAHFNPAVTFATMVTGKVSFRKGLLFITAQLIAATAATLWLYAVFPNNRNVSQAAMAVVGLHGGANLINAFFMEFTLTFILIYVIFATAFDQVDTGNTQTVTLPDGTVKDSSVGRNLTIYTTNANTKAGFAPIAIGFTLGFLCFIGGSVSGGAFNPARVFGPALVSGDWDHHWLYWIGDFLGGASAGLIQKFFAHRAIVTTSQAVGSIKTSNAGPSGV